MFNPPKKFAVALVTGTAALALLGAPAGNASVSDGSAADNDDGFQATGRPEMTNLFVGPEGPTRFTDRVKIRFDVKVDGQRKSVVRLNRPSGIATATFELEPGDSFPWHTHPGPVLVSVVGGGELSFIRAKGCKRRQYPAGSAFVEPGPVHTAYNQGTETVTVVGTFFDVEPGEALATPVSPSEQSRLDDNCGVGTVVPEPSSNPAMAYAR
ncbi:MAG: hypothetical protein WBG57_12180 [Ornithinimicrobium sp.]